MNREIMVMELHIVDWMGRCRRQINTKARLRYLIKNNPPTHAFFPPSYFAFLLQFAIDNSPRALILFCQIIWFGGGPHTHTSESNLNQ